MESNFSIENTSEDQELEEVYGRLKDIIEALREMNFRTLDNETLLEMLQDETAGMSFPIVREGANGIRASYSKSKGLKIFFVNKYENPENPERQTVEAVLTEKGLL